MSGTSAEPNASFAVSPPPDGEEAHTHLGGGSLWALVDNRLRGRWTIAILIGFGLAAVLGPVGFLSTQPKYQSAGLIRIAPKIEPILRETIETGILPLYQNFVQTQARLLTSRRVLERALTDERLDSFSCTIRTLQEGLTVKAVRNSELITVAFDAESPEFSQAAVNSILDAYYEIFGSASGDRYRTTLQTLRTSQQTFVTQIRRIERQLLEHASQSGYGSGDLNNLISERVGQIDALEFQIAQLENILASTQPDGEGGSQAPQSAGPSSQQLDAFDPELENLRRQWAFVTTEFESAKQRYRPTYRVYRQLAGELADLEMRIQAREVVVRPQWEAAQLRLQSQEPRLLQLPLNLATLELQDYGSMTLSQTEGRLDGLKSAVVQSRQSIQRMVADQRRRDELSSESGHQKEDLEQIEDRIMYLEIEAESVRTGRISIAALGDRPLLPYRDRRPELAVIGVIGGFGLSFGFFFLLGSVDPRAYRAAQLRAMRIPRCLGVLPDLGRGRPDPEVCTVAAHCVHQIRNHIEVLRKARSGFVLAVSSPYQGDGKTNIVMALGWSYATAGSRTLLVDCDFSGQSLSRQMGMGDRPGLKEILRHGHINGQVAEHRIPNLSVLPAGTDAEFGPEMIRSKDLSEIFQELRRRFDVIIVDTGPMLASLEGIPVASAADHTILSVRRGRRRILLEECVDRLQAVGASCLGIVLNYATRSDCDRYVSRSSLSLSQERSKDTELDTSPTDVADAAVVGDGALVRAMSTASNQTKAPKAPPQ